MLDALKFFALSTLFTPNLELWCAGRARSWKSSAVKCLRARYLYLSRTYRISIPRQLIGTVETATIDEPVNFFDSLVKDRFQLGGEHRAFIIEGKSFHKEILHGLFRFLPSLFGFRNLIGGRWAFPRLRVSYFRVIIHLYVIRSSVPLLFWHVSLWWCKFFLSISVCATTDEWRAKLAGGSANSLQKTAHLLCLWSALFWCHLLSHCVLEWY